MNTKDAYIEKMKAKLDEWKAEIDKLEARSRQASADKQIAYNKHIAELRQQQDHAQRQLIVVQQAPESGWETMKQGLEDAWVRLGQAFDNVRARFDESKAA